MTAGCSGWDGLDVVIEGEAVSVSDPDRLSRLATAFTEKYDDFFEMRFVDGRLRGGGIENLRLRGSSGEGVRLWQGRDVQPDPLALALALNETKRGARR